MAETDPPQASFLPPVGPAAVEVPHPHTTAPRAGEHVRRGGEEERREGDFSVWKGFSPSSRPQGTIAEA